MILYRFCLRWLQHLKCVIFVGNTHIMNIHVCIYIYIYIYTYIHTYIHQYIFNIRALHCQLKQLLQFIQPITNKVGRCSCLQYVNNLSNTGV